ncbi:hypothetical protein [Clostridium sp. HBUAS56017]|nr:hypothetical protein [Clostridium sp. HBUAS56017]
MILIIVDRKTDAIMYQGQPSTKEVLEELSDRYPVSEFKWRIGVEDATTR